MNYFAGEYDVAVVGAGHAGIEAALAAARLGCKTAIFTINMDAVGNCPCNPSIGGTAKGHLVREIDALGGEMGKTADECFLQSRMLNRGKGPAVHSLRAQIDRRKYSSVMKHKIELQKNLDLRQASHLHCAGSAPDCYGQGHPDRSFHHHPRWRNHLGCCVHRKRPAADHRYPADRSGHHHRGQLFQELCQERKEQRKGFCLIYP